MNVLVGLSGGVDSSVAAKILLNEGHQVHGFTIRLFHGNKKHDADIEKATRVAAVLGIPHYVYDFTNEFKKHVIDYFVHSYKNGNTPNPCYICNKQIKFGVLLEKALHENFDAVATGHYAKIIQTVDGTPCLARAIDRNKDQTYFLALLSQFQLAHILFPLGNLTKTEVRTRAKEWGLPTASTKESQDICFVSNGDYTKTIEELHKKPFPHGQFIDVTGKTVGTHTGLHRYTIGQRRGLALAFGTPVYVVEKNAAQNTITVGTKNHLACAGFFANSLNLMRPLEQEITAHVKTRYRQKEKPARIIRKDNDILRVEFLDPEYAVAAGQAAVFYDGDVIIGGGIIASTF